MPSRWGTSDAPIPRADLIARAGIVLPVRLLALPVRLLAMVRVYRDSYACPACLLEGVDARVVDFTLVQIQHVSALSARASATPPPGTELRVSEEALHLLAKLSAKPVRC